MDPNQDEYLKLVKSYDSISTLKGDYTGSDEAETHAMRFEEGGIEAEGVDMRVDRSMDIVPSTDDEKDNYEGNKSITSSPKVFSNKEYTLSYYKEDMALIPMPESITREPKPIRNRYKSVEGFNNIFITAKFGIFKISNLLFILCWAIALFYGGLSLLSNDWLRSVVEYKRDKIDGTSYTLVGLFGITRIDVAELSDGAIVTMYRDGLSYSKLESSITCSRAERIEEDSEGRGIEPREDVERIGEYGDSDTNNLPATLDRRFQTSPLASFCQVENEFIERSNCFRQICSVGNLTLEDSKYFISLYGPTIYDIHCSEIENLRRGGVVIYSLGILSLILLSVIIFLSIERFTRTKFHHSIRVFIRNTNHIIWTSSILLSILGFIIWVYKTGGSVCVDVHGKPKPCSFHYAAYFYIVYIITNTIGYLFFIINCVSIP